MNTTFRSKHSIRNILGIDDDIQAPPVPQDSNGSDSLNSSTLPTQTQRPNLTYIALITRAISSSPQKALSFSAILNWIIQNFPFYRREVPDWQNQVQATLYREDCFLKLQRPLLAAGCEHLWTLATENYKPSASTGTLHIQPFGEAQRNSIAYHHPQGADAAYYPTPQELSRVQTRRTNGI